MTFPLIGITAGRQASHRFSFQTRIPEKYSQAVLEAGGLPVILPLGYSESELETLLDRLDGVLLSGGGDIDPVYYHGSPHAELDEVLQIRDIQENFLVQGALKRHMPLLGICRGLQVMNVSLGGTLHTHIPDQFPNALQHSSPKELPRNHPQHKVYLDTQSRLYQMIQQTDFWVNSHHHQGIDRPGFGLTVACLADDRLIEGIEQNEEPFFIGVQWHPEWMTDHDHARALFRGLVEAAEKYHG